MEKIYNDYSRDGIEIHTDNFRDDSLLRAGLKLNHLRMIVTIEDHGQISAAADALNISQPAASRMLSEMEEPTTGTVRYGHNVVADYFAQDQYKVLNPDAIMMEDISGAAPKVPTTELRKWFDHRPDRFTEFGRLYREELAINPAVASTLAYIGDERATLLYGAHDPAINHAVILAAYLKRAAADASPRIRSGNAILSNTVMCGNSA